MQVERSWWRRDPDPRSDSLSDFIDGKLQALCVVDLFNEGLDVPDVDRVVMLRPTESKVIFIQQLGCGLRAAENKLRLKVIDFVGNQHQQLLQVRRSPPTPASRAKSKPCATS